MARPVEHETVKALFFRCASMTWKAPCQWSSFISARGFTAQSLESNIQPVVKVVDVAVTKSCSLMAHGDVRGRVFLHLGDKS